MKLLTKPTQLHPSLQRESIKLKRTDWAKFEDHNYRGIEHESNNTIISIGLSSNAQNCELDNA